MLTKFLLKRYVINFYNIELRKAFFITCRRQCSAAKNLQAESLDVLKDENTKNHRTNLYTYNGLVLRRGQPFDIIVELNQKYEQTKHNLKVNLAFGPKPMVSKGTSIVLNVGQLENKESVSTTWGAKLMKIYMKHVRLQIQSPPNAKIGRYKLHIEAATIDTKNKVINVSTTTFNHEFVLIFNPWNQADQVYLSCEKQRNEYLLNDHGRLWVGTTQSIDPMPWYYGQFEKISLETALYILDEAELLDSARHDAVFICRAISKLTNSADDDGILHAEWDKFEEPFTKPWDWVGSVAICEQYMRSKTPVRYGQCWVFAAVTTTLARSLGIPTRTVTNFESAHDMDLSMSIDYHTDAVTGKPIEELDDQVWNFHVWNESWFRRSDLPGSAYNGWQVYDATPGIQSDGVMQCGPASVNAIKNGDVYLPYDGFYVFAEVNADRMYWHVPTKGPWKLIKKESHSIGHNISTKAVGSNERVDITANYKYPEDSAEHRKVMAKALKLSSKDHVKATVKMNDDIDVKVKLPKEGVIIGQDFKVMVTMQNKSKVDKTVEGFLGTFASQYTGKAKVYLDPVPVKVTIKAQQTENMSLMIQGHEVGKIMKVNEVLKVYLHLQTVQPENKQFYLARDEVQVKPPPLTVTAPEEVHINEDFEVMASFTNTQTFSLHKGQFHVEGGGLQSTLVVFKDEIKPGETIHQTIALRFSRGGAREIDVSFTSDKLFGLKGSAGIWVHE